jgi:hypothetical protein
MSVRDGKTYQIKTYSDPASIASQDDVISEYFGIKFGELKKNSRYKIIKTGVKQSYLPRVPPFVKLSQETPKELFYRGLPIENLTRIFTIIKILNMVDIKTDHILVKLSGYPHLYLFFT